MIKSLPLGAAAAYVCSRIFTRKISGIENLPRAGRGIVVCNHQSLCDGIFICAAIYTQTRQPMHPLVINTAFAHPFLGWFLRCAQAVSVDRAAEPRRALQTALGYLNRGELLTIFPEGHLNNGKHLRLARMGAALLALESGAPIFPTGIRGSAETFALGSRPKLQRHIEIQFGEPINTVEISEKYHRSARAERAKLIGKFNREMMQKIAELCGIPPHRRQ